ncbi:MAG: hypothetical protein WCD35_02375 [Mycobacteriales bacterium]
MRVLADDRAVHARRPDAAESHQPQRLGEGNAGRAPPLQTEQAGEDEQGHSEHQQVRQVLGRRRHHPSASKVVAIG